MKKVIIIDDSITSLNLLKINFTANNWEVYDAQNAKIAYEMIYDVAPDLIITDAIMPLMGGFQLIRAIREDKNISKIPVIVYSILPETNAKFYIKEELSEYFLRKEDNINELLKMADEIIQKYPLDDDYKANIITVGMEVSKVFYQNEITKNEQIMENTDETCDVIEQVEEKIIDEEKINLEFKENYDFSISDEKSFSNILSILHSILNYDLFIINVYSFEKKEHSVYFDMKDILLSPIFQNNILKKYQAQNTILFKKYAPNLKMITSEDEFFSKIEYEFEFKDEIVARIAFYSKEKNKWQNEQNLEIIKNVLNNYFKARYINKYSLINKKDSYKDEYKKNKFEPNAKEETYLGIIEITNFAEIKSNLSEEDMDIFNSKISQKIIKHLEQDEQVYKNDEDEYVVLIFAKDEKQAQYKFNCLSNFLIQVTQDTYCPEIIIGASNCHISNDFNIYEAQKNARIALESASRQEKVVIRNE